MAFLGFIESYLMIPPRDADSSHEIHNIDSSPENYNTYGCVCI